MISMLRGKVASQHPGSITLDVNGVGYLVFITSMDAKDLTKEEEKTVVGNKVINKT